MQYKVLYLMGVSGSGKSTIGRMLAGRTGISFYDGDDFHPPANIEKMRSGDALDDRDRQGWLEAIHDFAVGQLKHQHIIIACSSLKASYRKQLSENMANSCIWIYLHGSYEVIAERMKKRSDHFMPPALLQSQFDTLEIPADAIRVDIDQPADSIVQQIISQINL